MTRCDFLDTWWVILSHLRTDSNLTWFHLWSTFHMNWENNDQIWLPGGQNSDLKKVWTNSNLTWFHLWKVGLLSFTRLICCLATQFCLRYIEFFIWININKSETKLSKLIQANKTVINPYTQSQDYQTNMENKYNEWVKSWTYYTYIKCQKNCSHTGNRTRATCVKGRNPNH